jgi:hypothetical protein
MQRIAGRKRLGSWPRALLAALALAPAPAAGPALAEAETVKASAQTDAGSGRLVLELRAATRYDVEQSPPYVFIRFSRAIAGDFETQRRTLERYLAELRLAGGGRVLVLRVNGQPRFVHHRRGNALVLTWIGGGRPATPPAENPTDSEDKRGETPQKRADAHPKRPPLERPASPPAAGSSERPPVARAEATPPEPPPPSEAAAMPALTPKLTVARRVAETRITVAWPEPTAAAVFRHGDNVWMVFSRRESFDLARAQRELGPGVDHLTQRDHAAATVLAARVGADVRARVLLEHNAWTVVLRRESGPAPEADVKIAISRGGHEQVAVPLAGADAPIRLRDAELGSDLHVVPSRAAAAAAGVRRFVAFRLVPAAQGAVVEALADGLSVSSTGGAVVIRRPAGLLLSNGIRDGGRDGGRDGTALRRP